VSVRALPPGVRPPLPDSAVRECPPRSSSSGSKDRHPLRRPLLFPCGVVCKDSQRGQCHAATMATGAAPSPVSATSVQVSLQSPPGRRPVRRPPRRRLAPARTPRGSPPARGNCAPQQVHRSVMGARQSSEVSRRPLGPFPPAPPRPSTPVRRRLATAGGRRPWSPARVCSPWRPRSWAVCCVRRRWRSRRARWE
jgi:hypothetical protein